jgi:hypothetical protein
MQIAKKLIAAGLMVLIAIIILGIVALRSCSSLSPTSAESVRVKGDIIRSIVVGESDKRITPFFQRRGWQFRWFNMPKGLIYEASVPAGKWHSVNITIYTEAGIVSRVDVHDAYFITGLDYP